MTTPVPVPGEHELLIPNLGSTVDATPKVMVELTAPLPAGAVLVLLRDGVDYLTTSVQGPLAFEFDTNSLPGTYSYTAEVRLAARKEDSNEYTITVEDVNQGWASDVNVDGPYAVGNGGTTDNTDDYNWHDSFWLALIGNVKPTDIVAWETVWTPGSDGNLPPVVVQHPAIEGESPLRLELQARLGSKGSVSYSSGVMKITLFVNGIARGDVLELTLEDDQTDSHAETATWRVWAPPVPPASIHLSNSVTMLPVDNSAGVVWYDFVVPSSNPVVIDTIGGTADTEIALYDALGNLIDQDDSSGNDSYDSSLLTLTNLTPGATYYLAVGEYQMHIGSVNWDATQPDGSTGETLVLNANLNVIPVPMTYVFSANEFGGNQLPAGSGDFVHNVNNTSGQPMVVDVYGVADVNLETSSPGTTSTRLVPAWSRMLGGGITGYEFWEDNVKVGWENWDPYDTTENSTIAQDISTHLYNGHAPAANRFVRFILEAGGYVEMVTAFNAPFTSATFTGEWATKAIAREVAPSLAQKLEIVQSLNLNQVTNPFSVTWDYSSSANGNIRTNSDLPVAYGVATPGVGRYFLKDGQAVTASMTMHANAGANPVLQPGDIVILQGVLHVGTLTGTEDSQTRNAVGGYSPLTHTVSEHVVSSGVENLQLAGEQGIDWTSTRTLCNYPAGISARSFTVKASPIIDPTDGSCNFWYGPFVTLTQAEMAALPSGYELTSIINGIAVYRGGSVSPANLIFADVNREIFTMKTEVRSSGVDDVLLDAKASGGANPIAAANGTWSVYDFSGNALTYDNVGGKYLLAGASFWRLGDFPILYMEDVGPTHSINFEYVPDFTGLARIEYAINPQNNPNTWLEAELWIDGVLESISVGGTVEPAVEVYVDQGVTNISVRVKTTQPAPINNYCYPTVKVTKL